MKGLILKDLINLKKNFKIFGGLTILYGVMSVVSGDTNFFSTVLIVLVALLTLSIYSYDDMAKWDAFALTMPISKENMIQGKYLMMLLLTLIGIIYSSVFTITLNIGFKKDRIFEGFESIGAGAAVVIFFYCICIPFITKLGVEKARLIFFAIYIIPFVIIMALDRLKKDGKLVISRSILDLTEILIKYVYIIIPVIIILAFFISYKISVGIYKKKEF